MSHYVATFPGPHCLLRLTYPRKNIIMHIQYAIPSLLCQISSIQRVKSVRTNLSKVKHAPFLEQNSGSGYAYQNCLIEAILISIPGRSRLIRGRDLG